MRSSRKTRFHFCHGSNWQMTSCEIDTWRSVSCDPALGLEDGDCPHMSTGSQPFNSKLLHNDTGSLQSPRNLWQPVSRDLSGMHVRAVGHGDICTCSVPRDLFSGVKALGFYCFSTPWILLEACVLGWQQNRTRSWA